jgi:hypothetical protein
MKTDAIIKGPKKSVIFSLEVTQKQVKQILKAAKLTSFTGEELKYQEDGLIFTKTKVTMDQILLGAFVRKALDSYVRSKNENDISS